MAFFVLCWLLNISPSVEETIIVQMWTVGIRCYTSLYVSGVRGQVLGSVLGFYTVCSNMNWL